MRGIAQTLQELARGRRHWERVLAESGVGGATVDDPPPGRLTETRDFGLNPGNLRMLSYVPPGVPAGAPLVVALHGCTQTAAGFDIGVGWSTLADRFGFALLYPEQRKANNPLCCFNWFAAADARRGRGEARSIRQMIERMVAVHRVDGKRVYVTGLSAGGAMASVMLATYPDVFAGGAVISGLPFGAARNLQEALEAMREHRIRPRREWGDLVRAASSHSGPWPRVSVWHGSADETVNPSNAESIVQQWLEVHRLSAVPDHEHRQGDHRRRVWRDAEGREAIELHTIEGMGHGVPIAPHHPDEACGVGAPFILDVGISSAYRVASFWGLTERESLVGAEQRKPAPGPGPRPHSPPPEAPRPSTFEPRVAMERALRAAGLIRP